MSKTLEKDFLYIYENLRTNHFEDYFARLNKALFLYFKEIWYQSSTKLHISFFNHYDKKTKEENRLQTQYFLDKLVKLLHSLDNDSCNSAVKNEIKSLTTSFINSNEFLNLNISKDYPNDLIIATKDFINNSIKYDERFNFNDIFQALRNAWTMNLLQATFNIDIEMTEPVFGYSMLYPYTDNLLDTSHLSLEEKHLFSSRLKRRLVGELVLPLSPYEEQVFKLVTFIEDTYSRKDYYVLYKSLQYIHLLQTQSLRQQTNQSSLDLDKVIEISFSKGGLSVLTDAYLIRGELNLPEIIFSFGLGIALQLLDDLQDIKADEKEGNITIFTHSMDKQYLDDNVTRLVNFISYLVDLIPNENKHYIQNIKQALKRNCILMVLFAASRNSKLFRKEFVENIQQFYPYPVSYMKKFNSILNSKCTKIRKLKNLKVTDILDLLL
ncbi:hypothetical protein [Clostridium thermarum]|uniref:hypothetical protein n=1 Tax=Clostridium thermarum TaxID=1716543 RepID=UPI001123A56A|nr:hypothetical protein [Clostridium thermarum]